MRREAFVAMVAFAFAVGLACAPKTYCDNAIGSKRQRQLKDSGVLGSRVVDFMEHRTSIPVQKMTGSHRGGVFTTLLTVVSDKFHFALHTIKTLRKTAGVQAFVLLCPLCTREDMRLFKKNGLTPLMVASLRSIAKIAFREGGPMSKSSASPDGIWNHAGTARTCSIASGSNSCSWSVR
jgi:hypothetical protein